MQVSAEMEALAQRSPDTNEHRVDEPYRRALTGIYARLAASLKDLTGGEAARHAVAPQNAYASAEEFLADLRVIEASLKSHHGEALAAERLHPLIRAVQVFGFHLATVDLRQSSDQHERVVAELLATAQRLQMAPPVPLATLAQYTPITQDRVAAVPGFDGAEPLDRQFVVGDQWSYKVVDRFSQRESRMDLRVTGVDAAADRVTYNNGQFHADLMGNATSTNMGALDSPRQFYPATLQLGKRWVSNFVQRQGSGPQRFRVGWVPRAGLQLRRGAPLTQRLGSLVFRRGEQFYNFQGLRRFKDKFQPEWEPRYMAVPPGIDPLVALADTAALIAGGFTGLIKR